MAANTVELKDQLDRDILKPMNTWPKPLFWIALLTAFGIFNFGALIFLRQVLGGMGWTGLNNPVGWGIYITTFVFWVGIAHSGTLISAVLFLFRSKFRSRFNRSAEAMTVIAVMTAGLFPLVHIGRNWIFYWLIPYPNQRQLWVNFKSPLIWDVFAVNTYLTISVVFFFVGLVPDLAICRDKFTGIRKWIYGALSLGWVGSHRQWKHYNMLYLFLAAIATPLVFSVHSVVSWDFAMGIVPGWHTTIFAPYFVAGAIFSGCAMVLTLMIPMRKLYSLEKHITISHMELLAKAMMLTGMIVSYAYFVEFFIAFYSRNPYEIGIFIDRAVGAYKIPYWGMITCNAIIPLTLWVKKLRTNMIYLFIVTIFVNIGMWFERFNIIVSSLAKEYEPYAWGDASGVGMYFGSFTEWMILLGSFGFFFFMFLIYSKVLPVLAIAEIKEEFD